MAEVSQHTGEVEPGDPFPGVLMLARAGGLWCSKRKYPASKLGQPRRTDHDLTHALLVPHLKYAKVDRIILPGPASAVLQDDAALKYTVPPRSATVPRRGAGARRGIFIDERPKRRRPRAYRAQPRRAAGSRAKACAPRRSPSGRPARPPSSAKGIKIPDDSQVWAGMPTVA